MPMSDGQTAVLLAEPSVQSLFIQMQFNGQPLSTGTGFVVQSNKGPMLVTNRHNVTGRQQTTGAPPSRTGGMPNNIKVLHNALGSLGAWLPKTEQLYADDHPRWFEHPKLGEEADFVALPLAELAGVQLLPYDAEYPNPAVHAGPTDIVSIVGFPFGIAGGGALAVWSTGFVASEPEVDFQSKPVFLVDCRSRQGQSGSPVIAYRPAGATFTQGPATMAISNVPTLRFFGIYSGRINSQSDLGMVWKASAISELISSI
jgi:hypothetical protein